MLMFFVVQVQLIMGGNVFVVLLMMMFCGVVCFSQIVQIMVQKKIVKVRKFVVNQFVVSLSIIIDRFDSVRLIVSVFLCDMCFEGMGWFVVCFIIVLILLLYYMFSVFEVLFFSVMNSIEQKVMNGFICIGVIYSLIKVVNMISDIMCGFSSVMKFLKFVLVGFLYVLVLVIVFFYCVCVSCMGWIGR